MKHALRPHQTLALDRLKASIRAGHRRPMVQSPTGSGKTILAAAIVEGALHKGNRVAFLVPALELVEQTVAAFEAEGIHAIGVLQGKHERTDISQPVQVVSVPTLARRDFPDVDVVVVDEAHELFAVVKRWMQHKPKLVFVGLSATPWTKGLGTWFDDMIVPATIAGLTKAGYLAPYRAFAPQRPDLTGVRVIAGDYHEGDLSVAMNKPHLTDLVIKEWKDRASGLPTLCFCVDRAHAAAVQRAFIAAGVRAGYVDGETPRSERDELRRKFHAREIDVVANVGVLTTGVDWDVRCIVLARPTRSDMMLVQIVGRALRTAQGKEYATLIDLSGSMQDLGLPSDVGRSSLDDGKRSVSERPRRFPTPCRDCSHLQHDWRPGGRCIHCGYTVPVPTPLERVTAAEQALLLRPDRSSVRKRVWGGLLWWADRHKLSTKWALANFHGLFDDWPSGLSDKSQLPDADVREWIEAERAAFLASKREVAA